MKRTLEELVLSCYLPPLVLEPAIKALGDPDEFLVRVVKGVYRGGVYKVVDVYPATCSCETRYLIELGDDEGDIVSASRCIVLEEPEPLKTIRPKKKRNKTDFEEDEDDYAA